MEQSPSWEANIFSASQKIPHNLWIWKFIAALKRAHHLSLSWARPMHSMPPCHFLSHSNIILPSTPVSSKWSVSTRYPHQNPVSSLHKTNKPCPFAKNWFQIEDRLIKTCSTLRSRALFKTFLCGVYLRKHMENMTAQCQETTWGMQHPVHWNIRELQSVVLDLP